MIFAGTRDQRDNGFMTRWFTNNLGLMALALAMAFVVWVFNALQEDPILDGLVPARVIVTQPTVNDVVLTSSVPDTVTVRVHAPRSVLRDLALADNASVTVDLSALQSGNHVVALLPALAIKPARIISSEPLTATVKIEKLAQRVMPVRIIKVGTPALGYAVQEGVVQPVTAIVTATESVLEKLGSIDVRLSVDEVRSNILQRVRLQVRDQNGDVLKGASVQPEEAVVNVPVDQLSNYRALAVSVRPRGQPAEGYAITSITANPQIVTVLGNRDVIQQLPGFIETLELNVEGAKENVDDKVGLKVPPDVTLVGDAFSVQVHVRIEAQQGARTVLRAPIVIGLDKRFETVLSPPQMDVVLSGPLPVLNTITDQEVRVLLDLTGLEAGVHQIKPTLVSPDGIRAQAALPAIQVEIREPVVEQPSRVQ